MNNQTITYYFQVPTIFPEYVKTNNLPNIPITQLELHTLKYKQLRESQGMAPEKQMDYLLGQLIGLSQNDLAELSIIDAGNLMKIVFELLRPNLDLNHQILGDETLKKILFKNASSNVTS